MTRWFVETSQWRTKDIFLFDNGIMPTSVKMCHINYTLVSPCVIRDVAVVSLMCFQVPRAPVIGPSSWSLILSHINSSYVFMDAALYSNDKENPWNNSLQARLWPSLRKLDHRATSPKQWTRSYWIFFPINRPTARCSQCFTEQNSSIKSNGRTRDFIYHCWVNQSHFVHSLFRERRETQSALGIKLKQERLQAS